MPKRSQWDPLLLTGDTDVDTQHMSLFALVGVMQELVDEGKGDEAVKAAMEAIVDYVDTHFTHEEALMERIGFPEIHEHVRLHRLFTEDVTGLRRELDSGHVVSPDGLLEFMRGWLVNHIQTEDRKIGEYIRNYDQ